ncbi:MAG: lysophospholipid acyltransferase family protein [Verrucomicrobiota bacterium]|jgi:KDO2-lipid IV(A) lauroyltransferase|nr:lysophospholipid acyltransferase family protein [Verrucomicrobiota bacterium]
MKYRPKHVLEYVLLRTACGILSLLPYRAALVFGWIVAKPAFWLLQSRRREAIRRLRIVLGADLPFRKANAIAWQSFRNIAFNLVEMVYMSRPASWQRPLNMEMQKALVEFKAYVDLHPGQGGIFSCAHTGNWELAGLLAPQCGIRMFTIFAAQKNPLVSRYLKRLRHGPNVELIQRGALNLREILANLNGGKFMALMPDLRSKQPGVPVHFLGGTANLYPGMGQLSRQTDVPIFLAITKRHGWTRHTLDLYGPFQPDTSLPKKQDISRLMQQVMDIVDSEIRKNPEQWFWYNKRWILDPLAS